MKPYYADKSVTLYYGDMREVVPALDVRPDCVVTDPPYEETAHQWDRWPDGWLAAAATRTKSMWCFGSLRMFMRRAGDFTAAGWRLSHDGVGEYEVDAAVWEKPNGSGFQRDRLRRVHELMAHWYRGRWADVFHDVPRTSWDGPNNGRAAKRLSTPAHTGAIGASGWTDDGTRLMRSVVRVPSRHYGAIHPKEKPVDLIRPLIEYACPPGGLVADWFAGSGSTAAAARLSRRSALLVEAREDYCELIAKRLAQDVLPFGEVVS